VSITPQRLTVCAAGLGWTHAGPLYKNMLRTPSLAFPQTLLK
jgi:hypothetical protein